MPTLIKRKHLPSCVASQNTEKATSNFVLFLPVTLRMRENLNENAFWGSLLPEKKDVVSHWGESESEPLSADTVGVMDKQSSVTTRLCPPSSGDGQPPEIRLQD